MSAAEKIDPAAALNARLAIAQGRGLAENVKRWLRFIGWKPGQWIEVQALDVKERGGWSENRFAHASDEATVVKLLDEAGSWKEGLLYYVLNEVDPAVATRAVAGEWHKSPKGASTTDRDIVARTAIYLDIDVPRPKGTSATDEQVARVHAVAAKIHTDLAVALDGDDPLAFGHSGNGRAELIAVDHLPETPELRGLVCGILTAIRILYETEGAKIDTSVSEAKRLCPAFGTVKRKGAPGVKTHPHRKTAILVPEKVRRLSLADVVGLLETLSARLTEEQQAEVARAMGIKAPTAAPRPRSAAAAGPFDVAKDVPIRDVLAWLGLMDGDYPKCPGCGLSGDSSVAIVGNGLKCSHNRCSGKALEGFRTTIDCVVEARNVTPVQAVNMIADHFGFEGLGKRPGVRKAKPAPAAAQPENDNAASEGTDSAASDLPQDDPACPKDDTSTPPVARQRLPDLMAGTDPETDLANAERFRGLHGELSKWNDEMGGWYCYDGQKWSRNGGIAESWAHDTARLLYLVAEDTLEKALKRLAAAKASGNENAAARAEKSVENAARKLAWAAKTQSAKGLSAMLRTAQCMLTVRSDEFDTDPWLFNVANGTISLRTQGLREYRHSDMITKVSSVPYNPKARCLRWLAFLEQVQPNPEIRSFLQRLAGYSIIGSVDEHVLAINYGCGRNGKGVFMNTLLHAAGDYGKAISPDVLMVKNGDAHPCGIADLFGVRLASTQETKEGAALDVAFVKAMTGGDPLRARFMRQDFWQFNPTHTPWMSTNHKPQINETKNAIWERVLLIPWEVEIPRAKQVKGLDKLIIHDEAPGVLAWIVEGTRMYQNEGLAIPDEVLAVTAAYRHQQDTLGAFIDERCRLASGAKVTRAELRAQYIEWAEKNGLEDDERLSATSLADKLRERGIEDLKVRGANGSERGWSGIRLKTLAERLTDDARAEERAPDPENERYEREERAGIQDPPPA